MFRNLRRHSHPNSKPTSAAALQHFDWLREAGLVVPEVIKSEIIENELGGAALLSTVQYIPAKPFERYPEDWRLLGPFALYQPQAAKLAEVLIGYYDKIATNRIPIFLKDLHWLHQYGVAEDSHVVLHDTDPMMIDLDLNDPFARSLIISSLHGVAWWATHIQPRTTGQELRMLISATVGQFVPSY